MGNWRAEEVETPRAKSQTFLCILKTKFLSTLQQDKLTQLMKSAC